MSERSVFRSALDESGLHNMSAHLEDVFRTKGLNAALSAMDKFRSDSAEYRKQVERSAAEYGLYGEQGAPRPQYDQRREHSDREKGYK